MTIVDISKTHKSKRSRAAEFYDITKFLDNLILVCIKYTYLKLQHNVRIANLQHQDS